MDKVMGIYDGGIVTYDNVLLTDGHMIIRLNNQYYTI